MSTERFSQKQFLETQIGGSWIGIRFNTEPRQGVDSINTPMRICEAIQQAKNQHFILPSSKISCMGGCRSVGSLPNEEELVLHVSEETGIPSPSIRSLIQSTPCLTDVHSLEFGEIDHPDIWISYCTPKTAMKMVRLWQARFAKEIPFEISTFLATCGNVLAKAFLSNQVCLSLGCPTSRERGYIADHELVVGIPSPLLDSMQIEK